MNDKRQTPLHSLISSMTTVLSIATCTTNLLHVSNTASFLKARQHIETVTRLCLTTHFFLCELLDIGMDEHMRVEKKEKTNK